jgi:hypothetical protein
MRIDLHTHSSRSDGTDTPTELVRSGLSRRRARRDRADRPRHDGRVGRGRRAGEQSGVDVICGAELSCRLDGIQIHLLMYNFDRGRAGVRRPAGAAARRPRAPGRADRRALPRARRADHLVPGRAGSPATPRSAVRTWPARWSTRAWCRPSTRPSPRTGWPTAAARYVEKYALDPFLALDLARRGRRGHGLRAPGRGGPRAGSSATSRSPRWPPRAQRHRGRPRRPRRVPRARIRALAADLGLAATGSSDYHGARKTFGSGRTPPRRRRSRRCSARWSRRSRRRPGPGTDLRHGGTGSIMFNSKPVRRPFITLFVIMDPPGTVPIFLALTSGRSKRDRRKLAAQAASGLVPGGHLLRPVRPADPGATSASPCPRWRAPAGCCFC